MISSSPECNFNVALTEWIRWTAALIEPLLSTCIVHSFKDTQHRLLRHSDVNGSDLVWTGLNCGLCVCVCFVNLCVCVCARDD